MPSSSPLPLPPPLVEPPLRAVDVIPGAAITLAGVVGLVGALMTEAFWTSPDLPWVDGQWGVAYEDALDEELFVHDVGVDTWGILEWGLFGTGRAGVIAGDDGWLYTSEEFQTWAGDAENVARNAAVVVAVRDAMVERNVTLVVAVVPAKARIMAEHLGRYRVPAAAAGRPAAFVAQLLGAGLRVVELEGALRDGKAQGDVFLRTDTHWTPLGAGVAGRALSAAIRAAAPPAWLDGAKVTVGAGSSAPHSGDLLRYVPLGPLQARLGPPVDTLATPSVKVETSAGLLDDVTIPVALVGTSYSDDPRWGFVGALQKELGADVLNAAAEGKGPIVSMMTYLEDDAWRTTPPQLVIWEIPERYLGRADDLSGFAFAAGRTW